MRSSRSITSQDDDGSRNRTLPGSGPWRGRGRGGRGERAAQASAGVARWSPARTPAMRSWSASCTLMNRTPRCVGVSRASTASQCTCSDDAGEEELHAPLGDLAQARALEQQGAAHAEVGGDGRHGLAVGAVGPDRGRLDGGDERRALGAAAFGHLDPVDDDELQLIAVGLLERHAAQRDRGAPVLEGEEAQRAGGQPRLDLLGDVALAGSASRPGPGRTGPGTRCS